MSSDLDEELIRARKPHHDSIICSYRAYDEIEQSIASKVSYRSNSVSETDSIEIAGLEVRAIEALPPYFILICKKDDVFPVAGDYE